MEAGATVLVGPNNAGKTCLLDALEALLTYKGDKRPFRDEDFHNGSVTQSEIRVDVILRPSRGDSFAPGELGSTMPNVHNGREGIRLSLTSSFDSDPSVEAVVSTLSRVDLNGGRTQERLFRFPFWNQLPTRVFRADNDTERALAAYGSDWKRLVGRARPTDAAMQKAIVGLTRASRRLVKDTPALKDLADQLEPSLAALGMLEGGSVEISVAPLEPNELLRNIQVAMKLSKAGSFLPPSRHGLGSQRLLLFSLYRLLTEYLSNSETDNVSPILLVEEPEAHLHPTATRALAAEIKKLPGQVVVTTHAPDFIQSFEPESLRTVRRSGLTSSVRKATSAPKRMLREHPRSFFAASIVLVEGQGEELVLPIFAEALQIDLNGAGIEILNAQGQTNMPALWKAIGPNGLGFPIVCVADADVEKHLVDFWKASGGTPPKPDWQRLKKHLKLFNYFTPKKAAALEHELVATDQNLVRAVMLELTGYADFADWQAANANQTVTKNKTGPNLTVGRLKEPQAIAWWLSQSKVEGTGRVAQRLAKAGKIPRRLKVALQTAMKLRS